MIVGATYLMLAGVAPMSTLSKSTQLIYRYAS